MCAGQDTVSPPDLIIDHKRLFLNKVEPGVFFMLDADLQSVIDELFIATQPAHLQKGFSRKLGAEERDGLRAEIIREKLTLTSRPKSKKINPSSEEESAR